MNIHKNMNNLIFELKKGSYKVTEKGITQQIIITQPRMKVNLTRETIPKALLKLHLPEVKIPRVIQIRKDSIM